jgi:hypothetical protein
MKGDRADSSSGIASLIRLGTADSSRGAHKLSQAAGALDAHPNTGADTRQSAAQALLKAVKKRSLHGALTVANDPPLSKVATAAAFVVTALQVRSIAAKTICQRAFIAPVDGARRQSSVRVCKAEYLALPARFFLFVVTNCGRDT